MIHPEHENVAIFKGSQLDELTKIVQQWADLTRGLGKIGVETKAVLLALGVKE